jgi:hypothetical protein
MSFAVDNNTKKERSAKHIKMMLQNTAVSEAVPTQMSSRRRKHNIGKANSMMSAGN